MCCSREDEVVCRQKKGGKVLSSRGVDVSKVATI